LVTKKIILLLIVLSVISLGCLSSEDEDKNKREDREAGGSSGGAQRPREVKTPIGIHGETWTQKETGTEGEMWTQEETQSQKELETPTETETQGEVETPEETVTSKIEKEPGIRQTEEGKRADTAQPTGIAQPNETTATTHLVRLKDYLMIPSSLKINVGDTVVWKNYQESSVLILTSREHLFEDQRLVYGDTLKYTFKESGSYNFSVKGYPKMQMTITVK
jgi:plastocyanin